LEAGRAGEAFAACESVFESLGGRVVVSDVKMGVGPAVSNAVVSFYEADVVEESKRGIRCLRCPWPFGMALPLRHFVSGEGYRTDSYRYGPDSHRDQGQEGDDEWAGDGNMVAFKYRVHDASLGRFTHCCLFFSGIRECFAILSVDPLASKYPWNSSYAFCENIVINARELEGLETYYTFYLEEIAADPERAEANLKLHESGGLVAAMVLLTCEALITKGRISLFLMTMELGDILHDVAKAEREYWKGNYVEAARLQKSAGERLTMLGAIVAGRSG
jgi:hypothetical protein